MFVLLLKQHLPGRHATITIEVREKYIYAFIIMHRHHNCVKSEQYVLIRQHFTDIQIQVDASNYKINTYNQKADGTYKRDKKPLPREIEDGRCAVFSTTKMVDPCKPNFWSIGIQGSLYNVDAEDGWVFKDKDCQTYLFSNLPIVDPERKPSGSPTLKPTSSPTTSPTLSSKPSVRPTSKPTLSTRPSSNPTSSPTVSSKPSGQPTASPTVSSKPSGQPTASPTLSSKPSGQPTSSPTLSSKPSGQPTSSPTLSSKPSTLPTLNPTALV
jgi:hypothetical protein